MRPISCEPCGEPVPLSGEVQPSSPASRLALRSGVALFWALVIGIVAARAVLFDPDFAERFGSVASLMNQLRAAVGV